jgi:hypothetical protein
MKKSFWIARCTLLVWCWAGMWTIEESYQYAKGIYDPTKSPMKTLEAIASNY